MNRHARLLVLGFAIWCLDYAVSAGAVIAYWHFNDNDTVVDQGEGILSTDFPTADIRYLAGSALNSVGGAVAGSALVVEGQANNGRFLDFRVNTTGYRGIGMSLAAQRTSTGFNSNQLAYSMDGGSTFENFGSPFTPGSSFSLFSADLTPVSGLARNANAVFRILFQGATSSTGNNRLDNIQFTGTVDTGSQDDPPPLPTGSLPEPASNMAWLLAGISSVLGDRLRRRMLIRRDEKERDEVPIADNGVGSWSG